MEEIKKYQFRADSDYGMPVRTPDGMKAIARVRFLTDQEWEQRLRSNRRVTTQLGRGNFQPQNFPSPETNLKLYNAAKVNGAPEIDGDMAMLVFDELSNVIIRDVKIEGNMATVQMAVYGGRVAHTMHVPSAQQARVLSESSQRMTTLPHGRVETRFSMMPGAKLWDECGGKSDDYVDGIIPAPHKFAAIEAVIAELQKEVAPPVEETDDF